MSTSLAARAVNTVIPAVTSETAGQLTRGTAAEPAARVLGAILGGVGGAKVITPARPATPAYQQAVDTLQREIPGLQLSAGERTNSNVMKIMESVAGEMPFSSGHAQDLNTAKAAAINRYFTEKAFDPAELTARGLPQEAVGPRQDVMAAGRQSLSDKYNDLARRNDDVEPERDPKHP
jgi:hypothetical protein